MKQIVWFRTVLLLLSYLLAHLSAHAQVLPRLYLVEKESLIGFIRAESHLPLKVENDLYFSQIVLPASRLATAYVEEDFPPSLSASGRMNKCNNASVTSNGWEINEQTLNAFLARSHGRQVIHSIALSTKDKRELVDAIESLPFFLKLQDVLDQITVKANPPHVQRALRDTTSNRLRREMITKRNAKHILIEEAEEIREAFCRVPEPQQQQVVQAIVRHAGRDDLGTLDLGEAERCFMHELSLANTQLKCRAEKANCTERPMFPICSMKNDWPSQAMPFVLIERTNAWLTNFDRYIEQEIPFFSVGNIHLLDTSLGKGLLTLLSERGYRVTLVQTKAQLEYASARIKEVSRTRK
ncbi:MAG: hypothetical protein ING73_12610 [Rhodocyclaceae bacterium]|nr:hypothetical protein [Rhodocyclaceae bacterium]MCA3036203.1 hypothetical protein [Rhodocyclaceae bacterium]MCA3040481.1 hypothetical protein [Rhodocyclaceae bacterium]MCA3046610.1 hypothetical protein [Rhodocyclaceae bacterium]MCA3050619.1 hypothetical protein [Rhodocyclaceae bacterium]